LLTTSKSALLTPYNENMEKDLSTFTAANKSKIVAASRKALIAAYAHYFAWPTDRQERYCATMPSEAYTRVQRVLLNSLLGIRCSPDEDEIDAAWKDVPTKKLYLLNWASLLTRGIGDDFFYLNVFMDEGKSVLDYTSLYHYDYQFHLFQESSKAEDSDDYEPCDYYAWRHSSWARLLVNDQFYYASLLSVATHFLDEIGSAGDDVIRRLIPHRYVDGVDNGKPVDGGFVWDMKLDADGFEGELEELRDRWCGYQHQRWVALSQMFAQSEPAVYTHDIETDDDPHRLFLFNNEHILKQIRWQSFLNDCEPHMRSFADLSSSLSDEIQCAHSWLMQNHQDILDNYDPNVVKLRKKRQLILTQNAIDNFNQIEHDDESED
jgi:hypothetical protein